MAIQLESSQVIDRPIHKVFHFYAVEHVRNHPRWDADIELWLNSDVPIEVGTVINRRNNHSGTPIEGTMEIVEFDPDRAIAMLIHDGPNVMRGRTTFEAISPEQTRLTLIVELPGMDASTDKTFMNNLLERSAGIRKQLMETEL
jgi:hypothetical protein